MEGSFSGYLPYNQQQPSSNAQSQQQQQQNNQQSAHASPTSISAASQLPASHPHHHHQAHQQHPSMNGYGQPSSDSSAHPTLPPLQGQNGYSPYPQMPYGHASSQSHTPPGSHTPVNGHGYAHPAPPMMQTYNQPYGLSQPMMYPTSTATSMPQLSATSGLPNIRPMPPGGTSMGGLPSLSNASHLAQQSSFMQNEEAPTHVVGSQGRRGILPSAPGRPNPPPQGSGIATKSMIPQKDADGKFPCPHCNKTYLHAKHLKRHLLRHTGDRPYMCHLCKDTFSRSDILKRHFQKCSIRRGNPTGANHLAHQRRPTTSNNRITMTQQDNPLGLSGITDAAGGPYNPANVLNNSPSLNSELSARSSRANSLIRPNGMGHPNGLGLGIIPTSAPNGEQLGATAGYQPNMSSYAMSPTPANFPYGNQALSGSGYNSPSQPMSFLGQTSSRLNSHPSSHPHMVGDGAGHQYDWSRAFAAGGQDGFVGSHPASANSDQNDTKSDMTSSKPLVSNDLHNESFLGSLYSHHEAFSSGYSIEEGALINSLQNVSNIALAQKLNDVYRFCFPQSLSVEYERALGQTIKHYLQVDHFRIIVSRYIEFHMHWPILHLPTFRPTSSENLLLLAMLCAGLIYSPEPSRDQAWILLNFVKYRVSTRSDMSNTASQASIDNISGYVDHNLQELQGLCILQIIHTWHGNAQQRLAARSDFTLLVRAAQEMGLQQHAMPNHHAYSVMHATSTRISLPDRGGSLQWPTWIEQEKRNRLMYIIFLLDAALVTFFNEVPRIDPLSIRVMLPADEAVWQADSAEAFARALGLCDPCQAGQGMSRERRTQQPTMHESLRSMLDPTVGILPDTTNAFSKFLLAQALNVRIIACQRTIHHPARPASAIGNNLSGSGPATPLSAEDWLEQSMPTGGDMASLDGIDARTSIQVRQDLKRLGCALDRWKYSWDLDVEAEYRAGKPRPNAGYERHAPDFCFLGRSFLQSQNASDWSTPADIRCKDVLTLLRRIVGFQVNSNGSCGAGLSNSTGSLNSDYDMKTLFPPLMT